MERAKRWRVVKDIDGKDKVSTSEGEKRDEKVTGVSGEDSEDDGGEDVRDGYASVEGGTMDAEVLATSGEGVWLHAKVDETKKGGMDEGGTEA